MFIYLITNKITGKQYVGLTTKDVDRRISEHIIGKTYIGRALRKYGIQSFNISVIDSAITIDVLYEKEKYWIKYYECKSPSGYNLTDGGEGGLGHIVSEEGKRKIGRANKGNKYRLGHTFTEESRIKMSLAQKGRLGHSHTDEFKAKMIGNNYAQGNKGIPLSEEHKKKISKALTGNKNGLKPRSVN